MDAAAAQAFVQYLVDQRTVVDYTYIAAFAILYYDWIITLPREVPLVWFADWSYTKILFLLARYLPMINSFFVLRNQLGLDVDWTFCRPFYRTAAWLLILGLTFAEIILSVRTWAVWKCNRYVGLLLSGLFVGSLILDSVLVERYLKTLALAPPLYHGFRGCFLTGASDIIYINFILMVVVDIIVLVLMCISAWQSYRRGNANELSVVVHRDGMLFYVYLLVFTEGNFIIMLAAPPSFQTMLTPLQTTFYSVFSCRIVLNIRSASTGGHLPTMTELHTTHVEQSSALVLNLRSPALHVEDE